MADSAASPPSRPPRAASSKQRQPTVSTETENKLARAARSAQRLAQLSGASRDDSTLDLFPDDPTRATLQAMNVDVRQGTLRGFELPDAVLAAVGAIDAGDGMPLDTTGLRRAPRSPRADEPAPMSPKMSGLESEVPAALALGAGELGWSEVNSGIGVTVEGGSQQAMQHEEESADAVPDPAAPLTPAMAAATVARSVTALRQTAEAGGAADSAGAATAGGSKPPQRSTPTRGKATTAAREAAGTTGEVAATGSKAANELAGSVERQGDAAPAGQVEALAPKPGVQRSANTLASAANGNVASAANANANAAFAASPWREAQRADATATALRAAPELDRARATAFADTIDALYGVIADQRRAATDHSRSLKWMLSIVVGALLVTVAIGITQTVLLMRLTRETTAQQHRIEQIVQNQQTAMASLVDMRLAMTNAAALTAASPTPPPAPATPKPIAAIPARGKHPSGAQQGHRVKAIGGH
jgi:hypothetical protein